MLNKFYLILFSIILLLSLASSETISPQKWIDARSQGSYYASHNSLIRDDSGRLHMTYCSSGEPFNQNYAPDWRSTATYATDKVMYQYSDNNGATWSSATVLIQASTKDNFWDYNESWKISRNWDINGYYWQYDQARDAWIGYQKDSSTNLGTGWRVVMKAIENIFQAACTNTLTYFNGNYYLYFESNDDPTGVVSIFVAKATQPQGPYQIFTYDGWKTSPTNSKWKPVIKANILTIQNSENWLLHYNNWQGGLGNAYWGAGIPRVTQKNGTIYLYYVDTTYWVIWTDENGIVQEYGRAPTNLIPYQLFATSTDGVNFTTNYENRLRDSSGNDLWNGVGASYSSEDNLFYGFYLNPETNTLEYKKSFDGISWANSTTLGTIQSEFAVVTNETNSGNNTIETSGIAVLRNKTGQLSKNDFYLTIWKEYLFPTGPVGWKDTPNFKWYYGGNDIYGFKINFSQIILPCTSSNWTSTDGTCQPNNTSTRTWTKSGTCTGGVTHSATENISCTYINSNFPFQSITQSPLPYPLYTDVFSSVLPTGDGGRHFFVSSGYTYMCPTTSNTNILTNSQAFNLQNCIFSAGADALTDESTNNLCYFSNNNQQSLLCNDFANMQSKYYYKRNYNGITSVEWITPTDGSTSKVITINHGENKNDVVNNTCIQNTINPNSSCSSCYSGTINGIYKDCWESYSGFVTMSHVNATANNAWGSFGFIEDGPIVWPSNGYSRPNGTAEARGIVHPSSIIKDNYLYIFYLDDSKGSEQEGRGSGIKIARAQIQSNGLPSTFKTYYNESFTDDALPTGFNKDNPNFSLQGGRSSSIISTPNNWFQNSDGKYFIYSSSLGFAVTKLKGTEYYLGIEQVSGWFYNSQTNNPDLSGVSVVTWLSKDLINWTNPHIVQNTFRSWANGSNQFISHTKAFNKDLTDDREIDATNFYILGDCNPGTTNASICYLNTSVQLPQETSTCTSSNWTSTDGTCQPNNTLTRTWSKSGTCTGGITHTSPESITCNYNAPTCETFTYSDWTPSTCPQSEIQTKTVLTKTPTDCQGGNQEALSRSCTYVSTCTDEYWGYKLIPSICPSNGQQTKNYFKITNCSGGVTKTDENISCTYNSPTCQYTYSTYGACINGLLTRTATATNQPCQGQPTELSKTCSTTPTCTESNWSFTIGTCTNGTQLKDWSKISDCNNGIQHSDESLSCTTSSTGGDQPFEYCSSSDWTSRIEPTICPSTGTQTRYWTRTNTSCQAGLTHDAQETITCTPTNTNQQNPVLECTKNEDCSNNKQCTNNHCETITCATNEKIENYKCIPQTVMPNIYNYTTEENIQAIEHSQDPEAINLLNQAKNSLINNQEDKATAEINIALLKTKLLLNPNNKELETAFEQANLALDNKDYNTANNLAITAINLPIEENQTSLLDNQLVQVVIVIIVLLAVVLIVFRKREEKPKNKVLSEKEKLLQQLKNKASELD